MKQWEKIIATACVGTGLLWMGTVLPAQAAPAAGHFANGAMPHGRFWIKGLRLISLVIIHWPCSISMMPMNTAIPKRRDISDCVMKMAMV